MNLTIFGAPGSGKGTYASRLQTKLGLSVVAMGDIFREIMKENTPLSRKVKRFVEKGLLVPDDVVVEVLKEHLAKIPKEKGLILDGFPRTVDQAKMLEAITHIDAIILLTVPDWIIIERLSTRRICKNCGEVYNVRYLKPKVENICDKCGGNLYQRPDDTAQVIKDRINVYERQTQPLLQFYRKKKMPIVEFKCEKLEMPPEVAVEEILKGLKRLSLI
ncbi:nucleoside monophosphate kinase [Candidatus Bathyarchaeota archaeon]|nr:nucleoside monophosphate kinase [Candidatus Bathyarchaeota archaeon]